MLPLPSSEIFKSTALSTFSRSLLPSTVFQTRRTLLILCCVFSFTSTAATHSLVSKIKAQQHRSRRLFLFRKRTLRYRFLSSISPYYSRYLWLLASLHSITRQIHLIHRGILRRSSSRCVSGSPLNDGQDAAVPSSLKSKSQHARVQRSLIKENKSGMATATDLIVPIQRSNKEGLVPITSQVSSCAKAQNIRSLQDKSYSDNGSNSERRISYN